MATKKSRITITLNDKSYAVLKAISECSSQPMSTFVSEMLDSARPTLERMAATFQKIKVARDSERAKFLESVDEAQAALEPIVMETLGQFDLFLTNIDEAVEGRGVRSACAAGALAALPSAAATAPHTNRGDTPIRANAIKPKRGKASGAVSKKEVLKKNRG